MSIMLMSRIFRMNIGGCNRKLLAVRLADFADDEGRGIYPGVERLASETELSERTVQRILADFEREGLLICRQRATGRPGIANRYDFDLAALKAVEDGIAPAATGDNVSPVPDAQTGDNRAERGDTDDREGCHGVTLTVIEPLLEPSDESARVRASEAKEDGWSSADSDRAYWRLIKDWPGLSGMPKGKTRSAWERLSGADQQEAAARFAEWYAAVKPGHDHVAGPYSYFHERLWKEIPQAAAKPEGPKLAAPYGKLWMAGRIEDLLRPHYGSIAGLTTFEQRQVQDGQKTAEEIYRGKIRRGGWTLVNTMHERAADRPSRGYPCDTALLPLCDAFEQVDIASPLYAAWRREHERRNWPFLDETRPPQWVWFPAMSHPGLADLDVAVREAVDHFHMRLKEVRGDEHAA